MVHPDRLYLYLFIGIIGLPPFLYDCCLGIRHVNYLGYAQPMGWVIVLLVFRGHIIFFSTPCIPKDGTMVLGTDHSKHSGDHGSICSDIFDPNLCLLVHLWSFGKMFSRTKERQPEERYNPNITVSLCIKGHVKNITRGAFNPPGERGQQGISGVQYVSKRLGTTKPQVSRRIQQLRRIFRVCLMSHYKHRRRRRYHAYIRGRRLPYQPL